MPQTALEPELAGSQHAPSRAKGLCRLSVGLLGGQRRQCGPERRVQVGKGTGMTIFHGGLELISGFITDVLGI